MTSWTPLEASKHSQNTTNPIRKIVDQMKPTGEASTKPMIALSIGDPTTDGNLLPPTEAVEAMVEAIRGAKCNGYPPSVGTVAARKAVASYWIRQFATQLPNADKLITPETVILGSGASQCLVMAITTLCNPGDNILLPSPCFSLYGTICDSYGIEVRHYKCDPAANWEANLDEIRQAVDSRTRALLINNPSNPCGSNFRREHVADILSVAEEKRLLVLADEIYAGMVFGDQVFTSVADFDIPVPRIVIGGTAKNFVVPGWRLGWSILVDPLGVAAKIQNGMVQLSTLIVGPNSIVQGALDHILNVTSPSYKETLNHDLAKNAKMAFDIFASCPGLAPTAPQGAMYLMVGIDTAQFRDIQSGIDFAKQLLQEENVQVLPGEIFKMPNFFRVVYTKPIAQVSEAARRIQEFCERHRK